MRKFIRLDVKGTWRGKEHISSIAHDELTAEEDIKWEKGISCCDADSEGIEELYKYWTEYASGTEEEFKNMQLTIFEGECIGHGACGEEIATCERTLATKEALEFINAFKVLEDKLNGWYEDDDGNDIEISREEYAAELVKLLD